MENGIYLYTLNNSSTVLIAFSKVDNLYLFVIYSENELYCNLLTMEEIELCVFTTIDYYEYLFIPFDLPILYTLDDTLEIWKELILDIIKYN